jgi:hypothetical protein
MQYLKLTWSISKARDTYGYNVVKLSAYDKSYRAIGGGYDMTGTVFGDWLAANHQDKLQAMNVSQYYGARRRDNGTISLDGACGLSCMIDIAKSIGLTVERDCNKKGQIVGFIINDEVQA